LPNYIQHSAIFRRGEKDLSTWLKNSPATLRYENQLILANGDFLMLHGRFKGLGPGIPNWIVVDIVRVENGVLAEHWDVIEDEVTKAESKSGLPMFGDKFSEGGTRGVCCVCFGERLDLSGQINQHLNPITNRRKWVC
jgi:predicted SnoaL-like aldol condensation-catalyzing enzyme